ncbi:MAG: rod-binding protein [Pseudomonadota bacterium]
MANSLLSTPATSYIPQAHPDKQNDTAASLLQKLNSQINKEQNKTQFEEVARKTSDEFEAVFITNMIETMFSGINTDPPFGGGQGERVFRSQLLNQYAKAIQGSGGFGISDAVYQQLLSIQEKAPHSENANTTASYQYQNESYAKEGEVK